MVLHRIPEIAQRSSDEGLPGRAAIVWSCEEFYAASESAAVILRMAKEGPLPSVRTRSRGLDRLGTAGLPEGGFRELALWFDERYRAHAPRVALLHLDRFIAIWEFLCEHGERLEREGLLSHDEGETCIDPDLLTSLVAVDYRPRFLDPSGGGRIGRYHEVTALARELAAGRGRVVEFVLESADETDVAAAREADRGTPEETADAAAFEWQDFLDAMEEWYRLNERPESELLAEAELFRSRAMDPGHPFERSAAVTLLLRWFAERYGAVRGIGGLFLRFMVMAGFIEEHLERLVEIGFLEPMGERYLLMGPLFSALNNMPLTPSAKGGAEPFDFDAVVAMATACRELAGDEAILGLRATLPRRARPVPDGCNDPCPCGSGRNFKRCCRRTMN